MASGDSLGVTCHIPLLSGTESPITPPPPKKTPPQLLNDSRVFNRVWKALPGYSKALFDMVRAFHRMERNFLFQICFGRNKGLQLVFGISIQLRTVAIHRAPVGLTHTVFNDCLKCLREAS